MTPMRAIIGPWPKNAGSRKIPLKRCATKTHPKKAGKQNVVDITNQIALWTSHTVTLKSGKVIWKSDFYKHLGTESEPWPETDDAVANRQLIRHAACKTVAGQKRLDETLRAEFTRFQKRKAQTPVWIKGLIDTENQLPDDFVRAPGRRSPRSRGHAASPGRGRRHFGQVCGSGKGIELECSGQNSARRDC